MQNLSIGMVTAPRDGVHINDAIKSLRDAGFENKIFIYAEPGSVKPEDENIEWIEHEDKQWCFKNHDFAFRHLLLQDTEYIWLTQDDRIHHTEIRKVIDDIMKSQMKFWYYNTSTRKGKEHLLTRNWWNKINEWWKSRAVSYIMRKEVVAQMLAHPFYHNHLVTYKPNQQVDSCVSETMLLLGYNTYLHNPTLSYHIGNYSTIGHIDNFKWDGADVPFEKVAVQIEISSLDRLQLLRNTIDVIYNQADKINIINNLGNEALKPDRLMRNKIVINDDLTDWEWYFFTLDDSVIYPDWYIDYMKDKIEEYGRQAIVCMDGIVYKNKRKYTFPYQKKLWIDNFINVPWEVGYWYHTNLLYPMTDKDMIVKRTQHDNIPIICVNHNEGYLFTQEWPIKETKEYEWPNDLDIFYLVQS